MRGPFQGVGNIIRFNWPFYALAAGAILAVSSLRAFAVAPYDLLLNLVALSITVSVLASLLTSYYIYDVSDLYTLSWLNFVPVDRPQELVTINAGFDETSGLLQRKFPLANLHVFDFYDPALHTEASIKRARAAYPPYPGTQAIDTRAIPLADGAADYVFLMLAAHEIRQEAERVRFFTELGRVLRPSGTVIVVEHLRDSANFLAYNIGFLHFLPWSVWRATFARTRLTVRRRLPLTPFVTAFMLQKDGSAP